MLFKRFFLLSLLALIISGFTLSCEKDKKEEPEPVNDDIKRVTVVYAVNYSSLSHAFSKNINDMLQAMNKAETGADKLLLFRTDSKEKTGLYEATRNGDKWVWTLIREYVRDVTATDPDRLHLVLKDVCDMYPDVKRTLYFWGHGSAWSPNFSTHSTRDGELPQPESDTTSFGGEYTDSSTDWMNIDELANAIPDNSFDIIWFDCCYMSAIEVAYELRHKAKYLVAYPTEVWDMGLNYSDALPFMLKENPEIIESAKTFFNYYNDKNNAVTVAVLDLGKIEPVAEAVSEIMQNFDVRYPSNTVNYRRRGTEEYHDLLQLMTDRTGNDAAYISPLKEALDNFVLYKAASPFDFDYKLWINGDLCNISIYNYQGRPTDADEFYRKLEWYNAVNR